MNQKKGKAKISHSIEELEDGLILTLKDQEILKNGELQQDEDVFENYDKRKQNEDAYNRQLKEKLKTIANAATSHLQAKNEGLKNILPHYDDHRYKSNEVDLEEGNIVKRNRPKQIQKSLDDFEAPQMNENAKTKYYQRKKFQSRAEKSKDTSGADLFSFLNDTALEKRDEDNEEGKWKQSAEKILDESFSNVRKRRSNENHFYEYQTNEEEELLEKAIKKSRQKMLGEENHKNVLDMIKEESEDENNEKRDEKELQMRPISYNSKIFEPSKTFDIKDAAKGSASVLHASLPSERLVKKEQNLPQSFKQITPEELERMKKQIQFLDDQSMGKGLSETLKFLKETNLLRREQEFGRTNDKSGNHNQAGDRVILEYRNSSGKLMKPKQAFRYMSAIFHGQGPSKNKVEKIKKKELLQMKIKLNAGKKGKLLNLLEEHQSKTGEAHMVIQLGSKNKEKQ